jgi:hypothetical protein
VINHRVVFALADRATLIARLHDAIERSRTWADFRKAMPTAEYSEIMRGFDDNGEKRPRSADRFPHDVPGYCDGLYPPWLQAEMDSLAPYDVRREVGILESTSNGPVWQIPEENLKAACEALSDLGWILNRAQRLNFY